MANPLNAPPQLSIPYVVPKQLWTLDELKAALIREFTSLPKKDRVVKGNVFKGWLNKN